MLISSEVFFLNVNVGDRVEMKKQHPCGGKMKKINFTDKTG